MTFFQKIRKSLRLSVGQRKSKLYTQYGFTLIELMVVIMILTVITGITLANYSEFGNKILLRNMTYEVALAVRETQIYGISGKNQDGDVFAGKPIAIFIARNSPDFYMFGDKNDNGNLDLASPDNEVHLADYSLGSGLYISNIRGEKVGGGVDLDMDDVSMRFKRPEPDAKIKSGTQNYSNVRITVTSPKGHSLTVLVESAGQISIQKATP